MVDDYNDIDHPSNDDLTFDEVLDIIESTLLEEEGIEELDFNDYD